jgi:S1-C subfamily serine protease
MSGAARALVILLLGVATALGPAPLGPAALAATDAREVHERGVLGLAVTYQLWDEDRPWMKRQPDSRTAAAVLIDEETLLTTADVIDHATMIQLEVFGRRRPVEARVAHVDRGINLALLKIDQPAALENTRPVELGERTPTTGVLQTVRWRRQQMESASSRIIRIEVDEAWGSSVEHAFLQMRTDVSGGGWAEPVFDGDLLVGITTSQSKQTSRAIPIEIIREYLARVADDEPYQGFATLGVTWQVNRDRALTSFLGQRTEPRGIIVRQVPWGSTGCGQIKPRDILLSIDGHAIDAEGFYEDPRFGRLLFDHLIAERHRPGSTVVARVLRDGAELELRMTARPFPDELDLVPRRRDGQPPFVIVGGLIVRELDYPYLRTWGQEWSKNAPIHLLVPYYFERSAQTPARRRVVMIGSVLPSSYNIGYQDLRDQIVERVNDRPVGSVADIVEALEYPQQGLHVIDLLPGARRGRIVLDAAALASATAEILDEYGIPADRHLSTVPLPEGGGDCSGEY